MDLYELFQMGPQVYIPYLLIALAITVLCYCFIPLLIALIRKKPITKKRYRVFCYLFNIAVMFLFVVIAGGAVNAGPYLIWTAVFTACGIRILRTRKKLNDPDEVEFRHCVVECKSCGYRNAEYFDACPMCGQHAKQYIDLRKEGAEKAVDKQITGTDNV